MAPYRNKEVDAFLDRVMKTIPEDENPWRLQQQRGKEEELNKWKKRIASGVESGKDLLEVLLTEANKPMFYDSPGGLRIGEREFLATCVKTYIKENPGLKLSEKHIELGNNLLKITQDEELQKQFENKGITTPDIAGPKPSKGVRPFAWAVKGAGAGADIINLFGKGDGIFTTLGKLALFIPALFVGAVIGFGAGAVDSARSLFQGRETNYNPTWARSLESTNPIVIPTPDDKSKATLSSPTPQAQQQQVNTNSPAILTNFKTKAQSPIPIVTPKQETQVTPTPSAVQEPEQTKPRGGFRRG